MPLWRPAGRARERILAYGSTGVGKTFAAASVVAKALGPDDRVYVLDADNTWDRTLETDGAGLGLAKAEDLYAVKRGKVTAWENDDTYTEEGGQFVVYHSEGWAQHESAITQIMSRVRPDDWVVIDSATWLWDDILPWYIEQVHGEELPEFLMQHRIDQVKAGKTDAKSGATQGQDATVIEWNFINPRWNKHFAKPITNARCHVWVTAESKPIRTDGRVDPQVRQLYEKVGYVPSSQKRIGHQMQTVLLLTVSKTGQYKVTTVKDRGRTMLDDEEWDDMFAVYLRKTAGWKPARPQKGDE